MMSRDMTDSEAISNLNHIYGILSPDIQRSLDVAFKALEERPQGEWLDYSEEYGYIECPFCGSATTCEDNIDELHYCWNCGAHLQKGGKE
jgi:hypothetical protein